MDNEIRTEESMSSSKSSSARRRYITFETVASLVNHTPCISPNKTVEFVHEFLIKNKHLRVVPIVKDEVPIGIVKRHELNEFIAQRYIRELFGKKKIKQFMSKSVIIVPDDTSLEQLSNLLTSDNDDELQQEFIITRGGKYLGIGKTQSLLKSITERQIESASYANPLTGLPGNVPINEAIDKRLRDKTDFFIAYVDLDNFKPFNDYYGYARGDEVIKKTAEILKSHVKDTDFLGHIGGDDFVVLFNDENWESTCRSILDKFWDERKSFYDASDFKAGCIKVKNRAGEKLLFPLLCLSIGVVHPNVDSCRNYLQVASLCSEAKKQAKQMEGNSLFLSRRRNVE